MDHIQVPPPYHPPHFGSVLLLGWTYSPGDAAALQARGLENQFLLVHGRSPAYGGVFAFGEHGYAPDFPRVLLDHLLGNLNLLSPATVRRMGALRGASAAEVDAYSNGAMVAEAMIAKGWLTGVRELRLIGGDGVLMNLPRLEQLAQARGIASVDVYVTQGDLIPLLPVGWQIRGLADQLLDAMREYQRVNDPAYRALGLVRTAPEHGSRVHVHLFSYPASSNPAAIHSFDTYTRIIHALRQNHYMDASGALRPAFTVR